MKVSLKWLQEYVDVDLPPEVIADRLTMAGLEVEAVEPRYEYLDHIVTAKVLTVEKHPNADKLSVCQVDAGTGDTLQIICGAPNVRPQMHVPCALPGTILPGDIKIKKGKIRGQISAGMLCSAIELKLGRDASGIMDLEHEFTPGTPLGEALSANDTVFEIDLTPNRPDCLSYIGVAREVAAFQDPVPGIRMPDFAMPATEARDFSIHDHARVGILDPDLCPRYSAGLLFDVKIGPSPFWLQDKLEAIGMTPVNNVVDITNFVMMETGQPLHAFDYDKLGNHEIIVRRAGETQKFTTLDSKEHTMEPDMLMICDGDGPVAVAGVMGGENSEISDTTTKVLVESAYFNPISIRKTAKKTGLATDASHRFERGCDPEGTVNVLNRTLALIADICGAVCAKDIIDEYPLKADEKEIDVSVEALNRRIGTDFSADSIQKMLESVDFTVLAQSDDLLKVGVPSFRVDVERPEDLSEEIARLYGYNNIQTSFPEIQAKGRALDSSILLRRQIRQIMTGFSFFEAINYNFINENSCDRLNLPEDDPRRNVETILNPISDQMSVLRSSLISGLLDTMKKNISWQTDTLKLFEIGKVFLATQKGTLPEEKERLAGIMTGKRTDHCWYAKKEVFDFFDLKGVVEGLLAGLMIGDLQFEKTDTALFPYFEKGVAAIVKSKDQLIGSFGRIKPKVLKEFGLKQDAFVFDFSFDALCALIPEEITARPLPKFPSASRDITIIVDSGVSVGSVLQKFDQIAARQSLIEKVFLFDAFEGESLGDNRKSLSFRVVYRAENKNLKEKNIKKLHTNISKTIIDQFDADLPE